MSITIASWNIAGARPVNSSGVFDYKDEDIDYFVDELRLINPDIICLQEVHINAYRSIAKEIAERLGGYGCSEFSASPSHVDSTYSLGNAILYSRELKSVDHWLFPYPSFPLYLPGNKPAAHHDKGFMMATFDFGAVVNLQMMLIGFLGTPYESPEGDEFAREIEGGLRAHLRSPRFICGDFNTKDAESLYRGVLKSMNMKPALPDIPTRPSKKKSDYIFYSDAILQDSGVVETDTDRYLCWAKFGV